MIAARNGADVLSASEKQAIHRSALRILSEIGVQLEHAGMLEHMASCGYPVDVSAQRVRFPSERVEAFLAECPKVDWATRVPALRTDAEVFAGRYLVPGTERTVPWTQELFDSYSTIVRQLAEVDNLTFLGVPYRLPPALHPLYERLHAWRHGAVPGGSVHPLSSSEALWDLVQTYASLKNKPVAEVFNGVCFMISPLRLAAEECQQFWFWFRKGMRLSIGDMPTGGSSTPVTLAGHVTMQLAERLAILLIQQAFFGETHGYISTGMGFADMRTMCRPFGRPELPLANAMMASMARHYAIGVFGHSGLTDAKLPSEEAGAQKCCTTLATLLCGADAFLCIGSLSLDEIVSPIQAILDCEYVRILRRFLKEYEVTDERIGLEVIRQVGPGGSFMATEHTARFHRDELWQPQLWQREMFAAWESRDRTKDVDRALAFYNELASRPAPPSALSEHEESELMKVVRRAESLYA